MYAGKVVERAPVMNIYDDPGHPYTKALLDAAFGLQDLSKRSPIKGEPPDLSNLPPGCYYHPRCDQRLEICSQKEPPEITLSKERSAKCWLFDALHRKSD
jgi:oligopeptide/dipeptide ABC transporter ATP-binding protein